MYVIVRREYNWYHIYAYNGRKSIKENIDSVDAVVKFCQNNGYHIVAWE